IELRRKAHTTLRIGSLFNIYVDNHAGAIGDITAMLERCSGKHARDLDRCRRQILEFMLDNSPNFTALQSPEERQYVIRTGAQRLFHWKLRADGKPASLDAHPLCGLKASLVEGAPTQVVSERFDHAVAIFWIYLRDVDVKVVVEISSDLISVVADPPRAYLSGGEQEARGFDGTGTQNELVGL